MGKTVQDLNLIHTPVAQNSTSQGPQITCFMGSINHPMYIRSHGSFMARSPDPSSTWSICQRCARSRVWSPKDLWLHTCTRCCFAAFHGPGTCQNIQKWIEQLPVCMGNWILHGHFLPSSVHGFVRRMFVRDTATFRKMLGMESKSFHVSTSFDVKGHRKIYAVWMCSISTHTCSWTMLRYVESLRQKPRTVDTQTVEVCIYLSS